MEMLIPTLTMALKAIMANKLRSMLTIIGIIVGVSSVVLLIAYSAGVEKEMLKRFDRMGATLMFVEIYWWRSSNQVDNTTIEDAQAIRDECWTIDKVSYTCGFNGTIEYSGREAEDIEIIAVEPDFFELRDNIEFAFGRAITAGEAAAHEPVCVLGGSIYYDLFFQEPPVDKYIYVEGKRFRVVGALKEQGGFRWTSTDDRVMLNYPAAWERFPEDNWWSIGLALTAKRFELMPYAEKQVRELLMLRHPKQAVPDRAAPNYDTDDEPVSVWSSYERRQERKQTAESMARFLIVMGTLALLIGSIGVMNIMLVTVEERTPEIGLRKAIGATFNNIMGQFLSEAVVICASGGVIGSLLALAACRYLERLPEELQVPDPIITPAAVTVAVVVTLTSGLASGIYPAWRAAELDPIESLRHE